MTVIRIDPRLAGGLPQGRPPPDTMEGTNGRQTCLLLSKGPRKTACLGGRDTANAHAS